MSDNIKKHYTDCEILAPAGSYECMTAAFNAGADAVYLGGGMFGARAYAENFGEEELIRAIDYAHLRGKKLYLTVNTLLKSYELNTQLISYLKPLYNAGLDGVIVQDIGVLKAIRENFPDISIHASTQMTVTGIHFARELKELGVTRIVTARELSYDEIRHIYENVDLEIESFVHGALCYSYSGQCLLSSLIGGRSGNRGRCAQPCRLPYELYEINDKALNLINSKTEKYLLSPRDMCTLDILPDILKAGVYSLKIEGRMKKPEYVACVVSAYRRYIDLLKSGNAYKTDKATIDELKDIYNRGGFTDGYYNRKNGREIMSLYKPSHYGLKVGRILSVTPKTITLKALKDIDQQDVLEINLKKQGKGSTTIKHGNIKAGTDITVENNIEGFNKFSELYEDGVFRTRNNKLISAIEKNIIEKNDNIPIYGTCRIKAFEKMELSAYMLMSDIMSEKCSSHDENAVNGICGENNKIEVCVYGEIPEKALDKPANITDIERRLRKTGATDFYFKKIDIELDDGLFVPVSALNELRRQCLDRLKNKVLSIYKRDTKKQISGNFMLNNPKATAFEDGIMTNNLKHNAVEVMKEKKSAAKPASKNFAVTDINRKAVIECIVSDRVQLSQALNRDFIDTVGLELSMFSYREMQDILHLVKEKKKKIYLVLPYICREKAISDFKKNIDFFVETINDIDGFIVRNYEEYIFFSGLLNEKNIKKHFILDTNVYMFNEKSFEYAQELSERYQNIITPTIPYELNQKEICSMLSEISIKDKEGKETIEEAYKKIRTVRMEIYGYIPVMITAGCIKKTMNMCDKRTEYKYCLKDRMNNYMHVATNCRYCYNSIYNSVPLYLGNDLSDLLNMGINYFSIRFTKEKEKETKDILDRIEAALKGEEAGNTKTDYTRGHFKRGVM